MLQQRQEYRIEEGKKGELSGKRIALVLNDAANFFSHREPLARMLIQEGATIDVIAPGNTLKEQCERYGVGYHSCELSQWGMNAREELRAIRSLGELYRRINPDIIHHFTIKPVLYGTIAARAVEATVINTITGLGYIFLSQGMLAKPRKWLVQGAYRSIKNRCSHTVFQNQTDASFFVEQQMCIPERSSVIPGAGVYLDELYELPFPDRENLTILLPARLLKEKGIYEYAEAAASIKKDYPNTRFLLAGQRVDGCPAAIPFQQIRAWEEAGILEYIGFVSSIRKMLRSVHIVCLPSYREGLARCLVEGAAAGRVLCSTNVPGCRELIEDGVNGFLVEPQSAASLEQGLRSCIEKTDELKVMGQQGKDRFFQSEFSAERIQQSYRAVYVSVLNES